MILHKRTAWLYLLGGLLLAPSPSFGEELLRIAVIEQTRSVAVTSEGGLRVLDSGGRALLRGPVPTVFIEQRSSLLINGKPSSASEIVLRPAGSLPLLLDKNPFRGQLRIKRRERLLVINEVGVETYLRGVLPMEISVKWHPEVLKVQAVISRTYALYQKGGGTGRDYDLVSSVKDQVYAGQGVEDSRADEAIAATRGEVLRYQGDLVFAAYHSTSAGPTEDAAERWSIDLPYLKGVSCPRDQGSPYYQWERRIDLRSVEEGLVRSGFPIGSVATLAPLSFSKAGRVLQVRIIHSKGELILRADELRKAIGSTLLPSTAFDLVDFGQTLLFRGKGYGHGVGLCQWGAKVLAEQGLGYREILQYFYPGVTVESGAR